MIDPDIYRQLCQALTDRQPQTLVDMLRTHGDGALVERLAQKAILEGRGWALAVINRARPLKKHIDISEHFMMACENGNIEAVQTLFPLLPAGSNRIREVGLGLGGAVRWNRLQVAELLAPLCPVDSPYVVDVLRHCAKMGQSDAFLVCLKRVQNIPPEWWRDIFHQALAGCNASADSMGLAIIKQVHDQSDLAHDMVLMASRNGALNVVIPLIGVLPEEMFSGAVNEAAVSSRAEPGLITALLPVSSTVTPKEWASLAIDLALQVAMLPCLPHVCAKVDQALLLEAVLHIDKTQMRWNAVRAMAGADAWATHQLDVLIAADPYVLWSGDIPAIQARREQIALQNAVGEALVGRSVKM